MVSKTEFRKCKDLRDVILKNQEGIIIHDLIDDAHCSIRDYNMLKSYLAHKFVAFIRYDKENKMWYPKVKITHLPNTERLEESFRKAEQNG